MVEILKKYKPKHYDYFIPIINKIIGDYLDVHKYIKSLGTEEILAWLKSVKHIEQKNMAFFEECGILITLVIRLFILELDIEDVKLTNNDIIKLIERFDKSLKTEIAYRKDALDSTPKYTIIKD
jgi:hypothetical protein